MDIRIGTVKVAQRLVEATPDGFEYEPIVPSSLRLDGRHHQPEFKRHIESGRGRRLPIKLHTREIVKRIPTSLDQAEDAVEPPFAPRNFHGCPWRESESAEPSDKGQIELFVPFVVRNVQESSGRRPPTATTSRTATSCHRPSRSKNCGGMRLTSAGTASRRPADRLLLRGGPAETSFPDAHRNGIAHMDGVHQANKMGGALFTHAQLLGDGVWRGERG